jgi:hypothetical protein
MRGIHGLNYNPLRDTSQVAAPSSKQSGTARNAAQSTSAAFAGKASTGTSFQDELTTNALQRAEQSGNTLHLNPMIQDAVDQVVQDDKTDPETPQRDPDGQEQSGESNRSTGTAGSQQRSNQQVTDPLLQVSGSSDGNPSVIGVLLDVQV